MVRVLGTPSFSVCVLFVCGELCVYVCACVWTLSGSRLPGEVDERGVSFQRFQVSLEWQSGRLGVKLCALILASSKGKDSAWHLDPRQAGIAGLMSTPALCYNAWSTHMCLIWGTPVMVCLSKGLADMLHTGSGILLDPAHGLSELARI